jgi:hypothetical protein
MKTLEITNTDDFLAIQLVADFGTLLGTYTRGFAVIIEPFDERLPHIPDPVLQLRLVAALQGASLPSTSSVSRFTPQHMGSCMRWLMFPHPFACCISRLTIILLCLVSIDQSTQEGCSGDDACKAVPADPCRSPC